MPKLLGLGRNNTLQGRYLSGPRIKRMPLKKGRLMMDLRVLYNRTLMELANSFGVMEYVPIRGDVYSVIEDEMGSGKPDKVRPAEAYNVLAAAIEDCAELLEPTDVQKGLIMLFTEHGPMDRFKLADKGVMVHVSDHKRELPDMECSWHKWLEAIEAENTRLMEEELELDS